MDEMPKQLLAEKYDPLPSKPGQLEKQDYEYERHGIANIFMLFDVFYKIKGAHLGKKLLLKRSPPHSVFSVR
jgi:hypothetical protein